MSNKNIHIVHADIALQNIHSTIAALPDDAPVLGIIMSDLSKFVTKLKNLTNYFTPDENREAAFDRIQFSEKTRLPYDAQLIETGKQHNTTLEIRGYINDFWESIANLAPNPTTSAAGNRASHHDVWLHETHEIAETMLETAKQELAAVSSKITQTHE